MNTKRPFSRTAAALAALMLATGLLSACASSGTTTPTAGQPGETQPGGETTAAPAAEEYAYPDLDCGGQDFTILNVTTTWDFYTALVHEEQTGEALDDAIYNRNRFIEDKFNVRIKESTEDIGKIEDKIRKSVMSGDAAFDAAFCPGYNNAPIGGLITQNLFLNLKDIPELQLGKDYWNQSVNKEGVIGRENKLFFALSDMNVMNLQGAWCVYFNETMMKSLGLDLPYQKVKDGTWTLDAMYSYMKAGTQLNGADSYTWDPNGKAIYGLVTYDAGIGALLSGTGESTITRSADGVPSLNVEHERFYSVCAKIADMLKIKGEYQSCNDYTTGFHYEYVFRAGRALMAIAELKGADVMRTMDDTFGVVPVPKFNETQDRYYSSVARQQPVLVIPATNQDTRRAGIILDGMAYLSKRDLRPVFYDVTMSQKRLRNDESIPMLQIVTDSVTYDMGVTCGWTSDLYVKIREAVDKGKSDITSIIEAQRAKVQANIDKTMNALV